MGLPQVVLPTAEIELNGGHVVSVRGLSRGEALQIADMGVDDIAAVECLLLSFAADVGLEEARAWHASAPSAAVGAIRNKVLELSGLNEDAARPTSEP